MKRDIAIEIVGIITIMVTMVLCTAYLGIKQEHHALSTQEVLLKMYSLQADDLKERRAHRQSTDSRLSNIESGQQVQLDRLATQQLLLDALARKLGAETTRAKKAEHP